MKILGMTISKKMTVAVATVVLLALNKKLGLNLTPDTIYAMAAAAGSYCLGQGISESKKGA